jgi:hypothetical protein
MKPVPFPPFLHHCLPLSLRASPVDIQYMETRKKPLRLSFSQTVRAGVLVESVLFDLKIIATLE